MALECYFLISARLSPVVSNINAVCGGLAQRNFRDDLPPDEEAFHAGRKKRSRKKSSKVGVGSAGASVRGGSSPRQRPHDCVHMPIGAAV